MRPSSAPHAATGERLIGLFASNASAAAEPLTTHDNQAMPQDT